MLDSRKEHQVEVLKYGSTISGDDSRRMRGLSSLRFGGAFKPRLTPPLAVTGCRLHRYEDGRLETAPLAGAKACAMFRCS